MSQIYFGFYGALAKETSYTRGYYLDVEKHKDIIGGTVFIIFFFVMQWKTHFQYQTINRLFVTSQRIGHCYILGFAIF